MLDLYEMNSQEMRDLLQQVGYGHLGCTCEGHPYVVPMHYYLENSAIYLFTTEGMKSRYIDTDPEVCLQVEDVQDLLHWRSVIVRGRAERLTDQKAIDDAMKFVRECNPTLSPAINRTWIDAWGRANVIAIYCMHPSEMSGRKTG